MADSKVLFLTGITGTLGKEFVRKLILNTNDKLYVLVRRKGRHSHWDRTRKILAGYGLERHLGTRVHVLDGDITLPAFGLREEDLLELEREVTEFFHIAALTALNGSREECEKINVGGAREALTLAWRLRKKGKLQRFFYFSTAYVSGSLQTFNAPEDSLTPYPAHANYYESSKYQAEQNVRQAMAEGLPVTIFRPSIVVGDSKTGEVSEFNVIYPFIKLFAHGILSVLPTRLENSFNIVPIDFVINASFVIASQKTSVGKAFHLVSPNPPTMATLMKLKADEYAALPPITIVDPETFRKDKLEGFTQTVFQMMEPYLGYLNGNLTFDIQNTLAALKGTGVEFPKTDYEFMKVLIRYAVESGYLLAPQAVKATD